MTEPTVRELVAQTRAALDAGDGEYAKMLFAALMDFPHGRVGRLDVAAEAISVK